MELHDKIAVLAYELYEKNGRVEGQDLDNWLEAEKIVLSRYEETPEPVVEAETESVAEEAVTASVR